jgi:hypothetical protein
MLFTPVKNTATQATCTDRNGTLFSHPPMRDGQVGFRCAASAFPCDRTEEFVLMDILLESLSQSVALASA